MNMSRTAVERIKNIVIVVLILSAILLLYFLWGNRAIMRLRLPSLGTDVNESIQIQKILLPEKITINFGSENYTVLSSAESAWNKTNNTESKSFIDAIIDMSENETILLSVISEREYREVVRNRSIQADFHYAVPMREFGAEFGIRQLERMDMIDTFTTLAYSEASPESFFVSNRIDEKYYRITAQNEITDFIDIIAAIEKEQNITFYPLKTFSGVENDVMIPLDLTINIPEVRYYKHAVWNNDDAAGLNDMAKSYFGDSFDFTRKVTEGSGTIVYVYGYGEKVLLINNDGTFEYSSKSDVTGNTGFFEALRAALDFIVKHSEPGNIAGSGSNIYLKDVRRVPERNNGLRFIFGFKNDGYQVIYENSESIVVDVVGQKIVYSRFDEILFESANQSQILTDASPPFEILVEYYQYIYDTLKEMNISVELNETDEKTQDRTLAVFNAVMESVSDVSTGYLRKSSDGVSGKLIPVWRISVADVEFCFNMLSGKPER